jgi:hypothetical protein
MLHDPWKAAGARSWRVLDRVTDTLLTGFDASAQAHRYFDSAEIGPPSGWRVSDRVLDRPVASDAGGCPLDEREDETRHRYLAARSDLDA